MTESYKRYLPLDALRILFPSTLRRALPLRQIPSWYSGIQPIQNCVEHFSITSSGPPSLRLLFRRKQILDPIPLSFADFMSFHVLYFIISALYTQSLGFLTSTYLFVIAWRHLPVTAKVQNSGGSDFSKPPEISMLKDCYTTSFSFVVVRQLF